MARALFAALSSRAARFVRLLLSEDPIDLKMHSPEVLASFSAVTRGNARPREARGERPIDRDGLTTLSAHAPSRCQNHGSKFVEVSKVSVYHR